MVLASIDMTLNPAVILLAISKVYSKWHPKKHPMESSS
jgi:hypothetical protein